DPDVPPGQTWVRCLNIDSTSNARRLDSLYAWWVGLMLHQDRSLTQKMTLFWHQHIACELQNTFDSRSSYLYLEVLMRHALGSARELMMDITTCPAVLQYLSGNESTAEAPNENYAREMQELFTVGKGPGSGYTQQDINAAARILTGWTTTPNGMYTIYNAAAHDSGDKQFSEFYGHRVIRGRTGYESRLETQELIDMIYDRQETARHTCRALYRWFVNCVIDDTVETNVIHPLADILIAGGYQISAALRALLASEHFYDQLQVGCQIKNPPDFLVGYCRQLGATGGTDPADQYRHWSMIVGMLGDQAMKPGEPPNVAGWPAYYLGPSYYRLWINADTLAHRHLSVDILTEQSHSQEGVRFDLTSFTSLCPDPADSAAVVASVTSRLSAVPADPARAAMLQALLETDDQSWRRLWTAYAADPSGEQHSAPVIARLQAFYRTWMKEAECHLL
ncbi:MAG: DUF1800 family protein, partial [Bacteroidetes bacterium]|nr:DUF1800 family protein [Bacteroidota bacterium]